MPGDYRFSNVDTSFGLSSGSPYGTGPSGMMINYTPSNTAEGASKNFNDYISSLNAIDYERSMNLLRENNKFNAEQAALNRLWQENMSNTAYQRQAEDLRTAGYNPALVLGAGGASTPAGSSASASSVTLPQLSSVLGSVMSSVYNTAKTTATTERGQDITKETTERGQNMKLIGDLVKGIGSIVGRLIPSIGDSSSSLGSGSAKDASYIFKKVFNK